jgi:hypothetical protein
VRAERERAAFPGLRRVHDQPPVFEIDGFLSAAECECVGAERASVAAT